jgi:hypothetical protein
MLDFGNLERQVLNDLFSFLEKYPETKRVLISMPQLLVDQFIKAGKLKKYCEGLYDYLPLSDLGESGLRVLRMNASMPKNLDEAHTLTIYGYSAQDKRASFLRELFCREGRSENYFLNF